MTQSYITEEEIRQVLYGLVEDFIKKLDEGDAIEQLAILNEIYTDKLDVTYRDGVEKFSNNYYTNYRVLTSTINDDLSTRNIKFTRASRDFLKEMEIV